MGEAVLIDITCGAIEIGIKHLTVYAFSTENWKRSTEEVRFLMGFNREVVRRRRENLNDMGVRMRWVGSRPRMWRSVIKEFDIAEQMTVGNDVITINYCVNYGGRTEIVEATHELAQEAVDGKINANRISEALFSRGAASREELDSRREAIRVAEANAEEALAQAQKIRVSLGLPATPPDGRPLTDVPPRLSETFSGNSASSQVSDASEAQPSDSSGEERFDRAV